VAWQGGKMTTVIIKSCSYGIGRVDIESWTNPKTYLVDICLENGDTMPVEKENLEYRGIEEL